MQLSTSRVSYRTVVPPLLLLCGAAGRPIPVTKTAKDAPGYEAEVDRVHGLVISELQALYDRYSIMFYIHLDVCVMTRHTCANIIEAELLHPPPSMLVSRTYCASMCNVSMLTS